MTADRWTRAVRQQLGLGRLLPLGGPRDGAWIAERAAEASLRRAARDAPGVRLGTVRIALADPEAVYDPAVPAPPGALPPGSLRLTAEFAATASEPLPATASLLRTTLATAASERLGLAVTEVDLRVTALLDDGDEGEPGPALPPEPPQSRKVADADTDATRVATVAAAVPGVTRLTGSLGRPVHITGLPDETALPRRHVQVECAVSREHRAVDVARQVRAAVSESLPDHPTVAVLVTAIS